MKRNSGETFEAYKHRRLKEKKDRSDYIRGFKKGYKLGVNVWEPRRDIQRVSLLKDNQF